MRRQMRHAPMTLVAAVLALSGCEERRNVHGPMTRSPQEPKAAEGPLATETDDVFLARKAASALAKTFRAVGLDVKEMGPTVSVGRKGIAVAARINNKVSQD